MNNTLVRRDVLVHDACGLKNFWEKKIEKQTQRLQNEDNRLKKSALMKLRKEWNERLEGRARMLENFNEDLMRNKQMSLMSLEASLQNIQSAA
nr:PREDICTED: uncharacterized protein LOC106704593 isoform X2 [Latimeria chalumnae]|eukprot:XP_014347428.1 PREDICTED: uncharacterized protein LOC106704593 isoform X2 [Latimeria chalumnae]